ncbi:MAG: peptidoglycan DD-metalloendopeptidase family protein [Gammaproteobacteria bacterium]|nr:peptidoglycan DD-metalloendopeptidase family protein [Gammaproteobacteria bacterium]
MSKVILLLLYLFALINFSSCSYDPPVIIVEGVNYNKPAPKRVYNKPGLKKVYNKPGKHIVRKGETLYSIAWMYGLDYQQLSKYNRIRWPYTIFVGQKLSLKPAQNNKVKKNALTRNKIKKTKTYKSKKKKPATKTKKVIKKPSRLKFQWPIKGKIIQKFNLNKGKKGIDIALAKKGLKIRSAESGKVVYSGHGLTGYGLLLIIKHNNRYLSAYAHNSQLLVAEGMIVKKNQVIALSGKSATDRLKLHFEIRLDGNPVNPLKYLP